MMLKSTGLEDKMWVLVLVLLVTKCMILVNYSFVASVSQFVNK